MSDKPAVIQGCYVDLKFMPGIKCARVAIDIPIEHSNAFLKMFDAPDRANPVAVAIARLSPVAEQSLSGLSRVPSTEPDSPPPVGPSDSAGEGQETRRTFRDMKRSAQAALRCADTDFQDWIDGEQHTQNRRVFLDHEDYARAILCEVLGITSRKELDTLPHKAAAWDKLLTDFDVRGYK